MGKQPTTKPLSKKAFRRKVQCAAKGHGKQLWQHFVSTIMKPGKTVRVELMADGVDAFKFWKKLGFLSETKNLDANSTTFVEMSLDLVG
jgi:ribosomal protein S18 acetylase RimI-like enzyme